MAITTRLQTKYLVQKIAIIVICAVLGLWGIYDYAVKIPRQNRAFERGQVCLKVKEALEAPPGTAVAREDIAAAVERVREEVDKLAASVAPDDGTTLDLREAIESIQARNEGSWFAVLVLFQQALNEAAQRTGGAPSDQYTLAVEVARKGVDQTAHITRPGAFDRATQWAFILCLPFAPYYLWTLLRARGRHHRLDDDGTLHTPEGTWAKDEIADIDMGRWMSKSIAHVVHSDGRRAKLDDYVYRDTHLIVGAIASERYPDAWEPDGRKKVDPAAADEDGGDDEPGGGDAGERAPAGATSG